MSSAGLVAVNAYVPAKPLSAASARRLASYLREQTLLPHEYIEQLEAHGSLPGRIETNWDGWQSQPWFQTWLNSLPTKKRADPFAGAKERRRVPLDPASLRSSVVPHPMLSSDAETLAGAMAILDSGLERDAIDLVMVSSLVPDRHVPLNASLVQHKLQLPRAGAYNVDTCCSSFITMVELASSLVRAGVKNNVLLVMSAMDSLINDKTTYYSPNTGDAAAAAVVSQLTPADGYLASHSTSHGGRHAAIVFQNRAPRLLQVTAQGPHHHQEFVTFYDMEMCKAIAENAQADVREVVCGALSRAGLGSADIDFLITHQPVAWAAGAWAAALGVDPARTYETFTSYGNLACCSVPVNLSEAIEHGRLRAGHRVMMASPGVGENHIALLHGTSQRLLDGHTCV